MKCRSQLGTLFHSGVKPPSLRGAPSATTCARHDTCITFGVFLELRYAPRVVPPEIYDTEAVTFPPSIRTRVVPRTPVSSLRGSSNVVATIRLRRLRRLQYRHQYISRPGGPTSCSNAHSRQASARRRSPSGPGAVLSRPPQRFADVLFRASLVRSPRHRHIHPSAVHASYRLRPPGPSTQGMAG